MATEFKHWEEWKEKCNLRLCGDETKAALLEYSGKRFHSLVEWALRSLKFAYQDINEKNAWVGWDLFDNYYIDRGERTGKAYKDWLFLTARNSPDNCVVVLEKEMNLLLRNVVRTYIREHYPRKGVKSLDAPLESGNPDSGTLMDVTPSRDCSTRDSVEASDGRNVAAGFASRFFKELSRRDRVVLVALGLGLPASCAEAEKAAQCKKSMLADARSQLNICIRDRLKREMSEDADYLRFYVLEALLEKCIEWAKGEKSCESMFHLLKVRQAGGGRP